MFSIAKGKNTSARGLNTAGVSRIQPEVCVLLRYLLFYHKQFLEYE